MRRWSCRVTTEHSIDPAVLTTREAARYCGYSSPAGLLSARRRGMVEANGRRGGNGRLTWERAKLDEFLKGRGPVGRPVALRDGGEADAPWNLASEGGWVLHSGTGHRSADREGVPAHSGAPRRARRDAGSARSAGPAPTRRRRADRGKDPIADALEHVRRVAFEAKVTEKKIKSAASRRRWADTLALLVPVFGMFYVDERRAHGMQRTP